MECFGQSMSILEDTGMIEFGGLGRNSTLKNHFFGSRIFSEIRELFSHALPIHSIAIVCKLKPGGRSGREEEGTEEFIAIG